MAQLPQQAQQAHHGGQQPTIVGIPQNKFDPIADAKSIRNALKGAHTDEKAIIKILTTRSNRQLQVIRKSYAVLYEDKDLIQNIKDETQGNFETIAVILLLPRPDYDAKCLYEAMSGAGTNEDILIEILCTRTAEEIGEIIKSYDRMYDKAVDKIVKDECGGNLNKILQAVLKCKRAPDGAVDEDAAKKDAEVLYNAGEKKWGTDDDKFIDVLTTRSYSQIAVISHQYEKNKQKTLVAAIQSEMHGDFEKACVSIVEYSKDPASYYCKKLRAAMKGLGTDDQTLIRIMVARAEVDLQLIRDVFGDRFGDGKTLLEWLESDTSGAYREALVGLLMGNDQK